ncbi:MAG: hypothetical protein AABY47_09895 [Pseudomonadota bacterium]|jgi:hypothetical protein
MMTAQIKYIAGCGLSVFFISCTALADQNLSEIQKQFNAETISRPFSVPDDASLTASLKEATERGTPTKSRGYIPGCVGLSCVLGQNFGYGSYLGGYNRPYYGGYYGGDYYRPYYSSW